MNTKVPLMTRMYRANEAFQNNYKSETCLVHIIEVVGLVLMLHMSIFHFSILWPKSQKALPALLLTSVFKVSTESRDDEVHLHCVCESEQKVELKKSQYGTGSINKASTKNSKSAGRAGRT